MKMVLALRGKSKLGKSQTIRTVVELLSAKHPDATIEHNHTTRADVRGVLTINGLKIGIESQGGPNGRFRESLELFATSGCDVIICATRTSGQTVDAVNALQGFDVHWLEQHDKTQPYEQVLRSMAVARSVVERLEVLMETAPARSMAATA